MPPLDAAGAIDAANAIPDSMGAERRATPRHFTPRSFAPRSFAYEEIGWIAADATAIALRHGADLATLSRGVVLADAHRDAEPLFRLACHARLIGPARTLAGGSVVVATTLLCVDAALPSRVAAPDAVLATVFLDTAPLAGAPKSAYGRFGTVSVRRLADAVPDKTPGRSFHVVYVPVAAAAGWPAARPAVAVGEADLWPAAHLAFG